MRAALRIVLPTLLVFLCTLVLPSGAQAQGGGLRAQLSRQGFITTWLVLGPFPYNTPRRGDDKWGIDIDFLAAEGGELKAQAARGVKVIPPAPADPASAPPAPPETPAWFAVASDGPYVNLNSRMKPNDSVVAYAAVYIQSSYSQEVFLKIGSDDGARAWLNGELIYDHPRPRDAVIDDDVVRVKLRGGANLLLLKIEERRGQWGFYCRLQDDLRRPPPGVSVLLPGTGFETQELLKGTLTTSVPRDVFPDGVVLKPEVRSDAGVPSWGQGLWARALVRPATSQRPVAISKVIGTSAGTLGRSRTQFHLPLRNVPDGEYIVRIEVGVNNQPAFYTDDTRVPMRRSIYADLERARLALEKARTQLGPTPSLRGRNAAASRGAVDSVAFGIDSLSGLLAEGDRDLEYLERETRRSARLAEALVRGEDPYFGPQGERGPFMRAYRSPYDGRLQKYAVWLPRSYDASRKYPLLVALHGLGGEVMMAIRVALGMDQRADESTTRALRHLPSLPEVDWIVAAPYGYGDIAYRGIGTDDVLRVIDEVKTAYTIDDERVVLSGWSMGGIGVFELGMRHADQFAALVALCGYSDVGLYGSSYTKRRSFERPIFEGERGVNYAENGRNVPLFVVHGTHDNPRHSLAFTDRYTELGYNLWLELPEAGHNVWSYAFEQGYMLRKLDGLRRVRWPRTVSHKVFGYRHRWLYWNRVDEIDDLSRFARVDAEVKPGNVIEVKTDNVNRLQLSPGGGLVDPRQPLRVRINGVTVNVPASPSAQPGGTVQVNLARKGGAWSVQAPPTATAGEEPLRRRLPPTVAPTFGALQPQITPAAAAVPGAGSSAGDGSGFPPPKGPGASGPLLDTLYSKALIVYGTQGQPGLERDALRRVAEELAHQNSRRSKVMYVVKRDGEVTAEDMRTHHLVLVGRADQNLIVSRVADQLPLRIGKADVTAGKRAYRGRHLGAALIYPNPLAPGRTLSVVAATSSAALFDALHLPRLQPDYVVWDRRLVKDTGGYFLGKEREVLEAGYFDRAWKLPDRPYRGPLHWDQRLVRPLEPPKP